MTGRQGTEALAFARRKRSSGPFTSGLTPQDGRNDLELPGAAVRAVLHVDVEGASFILHLLQWDCPWGLE